MFTPIEQAAWPAAGEARDLRFSLNAPVLLGAGEAPQPTRAALGWLPAGSGAVVRLWLRADGAPQAIRGFDLPDRLLGPSARASALEQAERFLAGLGFLFAEASAPAETLPEPQLRSAPRAPNPSPRTSDPGPAADRDAAGSPVDAAAAVRADVRLTKFRRRGPHAAPADGGSRPTGGTER